MHLVLTDHRLFVKSLRWTEKRSNQNHFVYIIGCSEEAYGKCCISCARLCRCITNSLNVSPRTKANYTCVDFWGANTCKFRQILYLCSNILRCLCIVLYSSLLHVQKSCSDTLLSCTHHGNIQTELRVTDKGVTLTSPDNLFKHGIEVGSKQMDSKNMLHI